MNKKMQKLAENILKAEQGLVGANIAANPIRNLPGVIKIEIAKLIAQRGTLPTNTCIYKIYLRATASADPLRL